MVAERATAYAELLDLEAIRTLKAERHLKHFVRQAWHIVEPETEFVPNWHIDALCDHLEATLDGRIRDLVVTMPPRSMKSLVISVFFPAWSWIDRPHLRLLYASYAQQLSTEHSQLTRMVIESDWYQARWGNRYQLADDDNLKTRYSNSARGQRIATSVGAAVTGFGGDIVVCDDPHNVQQAESDAVRSETVRWWQKSMSTRRNNPSTGVRIVVQQRVHEEDVAGTCIAAGYEHLNLPQEYEVTGRVTAIGWRDPRTVDGELLWPARNTPEFVASQKRDLGSYDYAAQHQQRPTPREGGIVKVHWFDRYVAPQLHYYQLIQGWDTAFKANPKNDYSACVTIGIGPHGIDVLDVWRERVEFPDLKRAAETQHLVWSSRHPGVPLLVLVEDKGSGQSLIQELRNLPDRSITVIDVPAFREAEKLKRVNEIAPGLEARRVRLPADAPWLDAFLGELTAFPLGAHDDQVDGFAIAVRRAFGIGADAGQVSDESVFAPAQESRQERAHRHRRIAR